MSVQERLTKVQYRSKQAEDALKQLESCISVINNKKKNTLSEAIGPTRLKQLEEENKALLDEVSRLKEKLTKLECLNGIEQVVRPAVAVTTATVKQVPEWAPPTNQQQSPKTETSSCGNSSGATPKETVTKDKKKSKEKQPKSSNTSGGGAQAGDARPIDVSRLDMRIGRILSVKRHPDADTLYVEEIDVGEDAPRTVCSGLVNFMSLENMENRMIVVMCNLKPAKMRGVVSQAMVMCASSPDKVEILDPPVGVVPGDRVVVEGYIGTPDEMLNPKKKIFEQVQPDLRTNDVGVACYKGIPWSIKGKDGVMKSQTMNNSIIK